MGGGTRTFIRLNLGLLPYGVRDSPIEGSITNSLPSASIVPSRADATASARIFSPSLLKDMNDPKHRRLFQGQGDCGVQGLIRGFAAINGYQDAFVHGPLAKRSGHWASVEVARALRRRLLLLIGVENIEDLGRTTG
jgi:hypothetical protein